MFDHFYFPGYCRALSFVLRCEEGGVTVITSPGPHQGRGGEGGTRDSGLVLATNEIISSSWKEFIMQIKLKLSDQL